MWDAKKKFKIFIFKRMQKISIKGGHSVSLFIHIIMHYHVIITHCTKDGITNYSNWLTRQQATQWVYRWEHQPGNTHLHSIVTDLSQDARRNIYRFCQRWFGDQAVVQLRAIKGRTAAINVFQYVARKPTRGFGTVP
jgi:hypothetical protein